MPFSFLKGTFYRKLKAFKRSKPQFLHAGLRNDEEASGSASSRVDLKYLFEQASIDQDSIDHLLNRCYHIHTAAATLIISGSGELIPFEEHSQRVQFNRAIHFLEPTMGQPQSLGASLYFVYRALHTLFSIDAACDSAKRRECLETKGYESYYKGSFKILLNGWCELERHFIALNVSSELLKNQAEDAGPAGTSSSLLQIVLDGLIGRIENLPRAAPQMSLDFLNCLPPTTDLLDAKEYGNTLLTGKFTTLLDRLNQVFDTFSSDKLVLWHEDYCRIMRVMGESASEDLEFEAAMMIQDEFDIIKLQGDDLASSSQQNNLARVQRAWNERRNQMEADLLRLSANKKVDGNIEDYVPEQKNNEIDDNIAEKSKELMSVTILHKHCKNEVVKIKVESLQVAHIKRAVSASLKIPCTHQRLKTRQGSQLDDTEFIKGSQDEVLILDRPLYRAAWCAWSIKRIDEKLLTNWTEICKRMREKWAACEGEDRCRLRYCGCKIDPSDQFCYADDLYSLVTELGDNKMSDDEATQFMTECSPRTAGQRHADGFMTEFDIIQPGNQNDFKKRVYYDGYFASLLSVC